MPPTVRKPDSPIASEILFMDLSIQVGVIPKPVGKIWSKIRKYIDTIEKENYILNRPEAKLLEFGDCNDERECDRDIRSDEDPQKILG